MHPFLKTGAAVLPATRRAVIERAPQGKIHPRAGHDTSTAAMPGAAGGAASLRARAAGNLRRRLRPWRQASAVGAAGMALLLLAVCSTAALAFQLHAPPSSRLPGGVRIKPAASVAPTTMMLCGSQLLRQRVLQPGRLGGFLLRKRQQQQRPGLAAEGDGAGGLGPAGGKGNKGRRPQIFNKLSAILSRFRTFIRSKLMLKVNGRPVLKLTGWHASFAMVFALFLLTSLFGGAGGPTPTEVPYSDFMKLVKEHGPEVVSRLRIAPDRFDFLLNGLPSYTRPVKAHPSLLFFLDKYNIPFYAPPPSSKGLATFLILNLLPFAWIFFSLGLGKRFYGDMTGSVGKSATEGNIDRSLSFEDVAGIDRAKREVQELVDMLRAPGKYGKLGARLPKGILLAGPPGTGKTLLARVMAAEAGVPFIYCSGSDFVEMYIGRGAARVRSLFQRATKQAPCIIFMDELDTLGKQRSLRLGGSNDEVEQTLNQLLACMDGLDSNKSGVIVIAATNRYEVLDDALTRPGRLDRIVRVELPDRTGREAILRVHTRKVPMAPDVDLGKVAQLTPGLAGADLAGLVNEAAIRAVRRNSAEVTAFDFDVAVKDYFKSRGTDAEKNWKRLIGSAFG